MSSTAPIAAMEKLEIGLGGGHTAQQDVWKEALDTLSDEDRKQYDSPACNMLDVLKDVCDANGECGR